MHERAPLDQLAPGRSGRVVALRASGPIRRRLLDLGFVPGAVVGVVRHSPLGDPTAYRVKGALIALRHQDAAFVEMEPCP
ncbi:MAG: Ferrous iron transport protein A [Firmicutes bacterium ADurb.Bin506]|jgi:ferrous iron transport protein A|nr:MAG: Ferrous iron transport protein A [Firmicutes bacterium ADurb.Bin506]